MSGNMSFTNCCFFEEHSLCIFLPPVLIFQFVLGSVFNGISLWVFCFCIKSWKPSTIYLVNLTVADFLLIICLPFRTDYYLRQKKWIYGDMPCRMVLFMLALNRAGSIFFLTLVGLDRYFKVVHPHNKANFTSIKTASALVAFIWIFTMLVTSYILMEDHSAGNMCDSFSICPDASYLHDYLFILEFFIPLCVLLFCSYRIILSLRQRNLDRHSKIQRAVKCIMLVVIVFSVCFLPSVSTRIEIVRLRNSSQNKNCAIYRMVDIMFYITVCFTYMNSICNPLVYYFSSPTFRAFYLKMLKCNKKAASDFDQTIGTPDTFQSNSQL